MTTTSIYCISQTKAFVVSYADKNVVILLVCALRIASAKGSPECSGNHLKPLLPAHEEADLISLWARRGELDKPEWDRLWILITKVLAQCRPAILKQLTSGSHDGYINDYIEFKVVKGNFEHTRLDSAAALATFFKNYLVDLQRYEARRPITYSSDQAVLDYYSENGDDSAASDVASEQLDPSELLHWKQLLVASAAFFDGLGDEDQIYLSLYQCDAESEALYRIAAKYGIASYHYRAAQLGITRKKGELPEGYERTRIGTWLTKTLGLRIAAEFAEDIHEAFQAMCEAAAASRENLLARLSHA